MIISQQKMQQNFSRAATVYDQHAQFQQQQMRRVLACANTVVPAGARVLDIGCGTGLFAYEARDAGWQIAGVDAAFEMCKIASQRAPLTVNAEATALPFADGFFDAAVSSFCLQWVVDKPAVFNEIQRMLKPAGVAIIATLGSETLRELRAEAAAAKLPLDILEMASAEAYRQWSLSAGLEVQALDDTLETHEYPNARALLNSMRRIGAQSATTNAEKALAPRKMMLMLENYDKHYASANGVTATWQPILLQLRKPV